MEPKNMLQLVVGIAVGALVLSAALFPVIDSATTTERTFVNEGRFNYGVFTPEDEYTLEYTSTGGVLTVNGTVVPLTMQSGQSYSVVSADNFILRYIYTGSYTMQIIGKDSSDTNVVANGDPITAKIEDGLFSVTYTSSGTDTTETFTFTELYGIVPTPDEAVLKLSASEVYIKGDSPIYASGITTVGNWFNMFHFEGNYTDGITISSPNVPTATYSNVEWNIEPVEGYVDLYKLTSIEFDITLNDTVVHATYSYFAVPTEVTAELAVHASDDEIEILNTIPLLIIVGLIMGIVGMIVSRRLE